MVVVLVLVTIVALLTLDWAIRRYARRRAVGGHNVGLYPILDLSDVGLVPAGVFLAPGHSWLRLERGGSVRIGADHLPVTLLGGIDRVDCLPPGTEVRVGDPVVSLRRGARSLELRSPVDGVIDDVNPRLRSQPSSLQTSAFDAGWIYRVSPKRLGASLANMFVSDEAAAWMRRQLRELRDLVTGSAAAADPVASPTLADGGLPVHGLAGRLDASAWAELTDRFFGATVVVETEESAGAGHELPGGDA